MAFMKVKQEIVEKTGDGGTFVTTSGIYDVVIGAITVDTNDNGARQLGAYISLDEGKSYTMLYGALA